MRVKKQLVSSAQNTLSHLLSSLATALVARCNHSFAGFWRLLVFTPTNLTPRDATIAV
jgi:hypothetical protein